jgi:CBS domain-containing protein
MPLVEGVRLLVQRELKLLPVVDNEGRLLGAVSRNRVLRALMESAHRSGNGNA